MAVEMIIDHWKPRQRNLEPRHSAMVQNHAESINRNRLGRFPAEKEWFGKKKIGLMIKRQIIEDLMIELPIEIKKEGRK